MERPLPVVEVDPFDLPEWLGTSEVIWRAEAGLSAGPTVSGRLTTTAGDDVACDLVAVDEAFPAPVTDEASRAHAHRVWRHGQVLVGERDGRLTLAVPGTGWEPERVLEALRRLARAVGAREERFAALLRLGG